MSESKLGNAFISPHDDDVPFSLGAAVLDGRFGSGIVVTVFSRSNCTIDDRDDDVARVTELRKKENEEFFCSLEVSLELHYLDRLDAPLRLGIRDERVFDAVSPASDEEEAECLCVALRQMLQWAGVLFAPLGLGGHVDHVLVHKAACTFTRDGWATAFYEDLPYAARMEPADIERIVKDTQSKIGQPLRALNIRSCSDASRKRRALCAYKSQIDQRMIDEILSYGQRLGGASIAERLWCDPTAFKRLNVELLMRKI